jgi:hypothetical protein
VPSAVATERSARSPPRTMQADCYAGSWCRMCYLVCAVESGGAGSATPMQPVQWSRCDGSQVVRVCQANSHELDL